MKTIGMIGGMSWESTASYYTQINRGVKAALGGFHSAKICLYSVDFDEIEKQQREGDWEAMGSTLANAARSVEAGGAECIVLCTNTMHKVAPAIESAVAIPMLHIADATAEKLVADNIGRVGLLGTRFTMEQDFYKGRLQDKFGIDVVVPEADDRNLIHDVIFNELCLGEIRDESAKAYLQIVGSLKASGAEAVILGCTEIALLIGQDDTDVPLYDTTGLHAARAVQFALDG